MSDTSMEVIVSICLLAIGLILGFRLGLEKALRDPHYAAGFIAGFNLKFAWRFFTGRDKGDE